MRSCSVRPEASPPARRAKNLSRVSARFSKSAGRISRERGSRDKTTSDAMDGARRRGERRLAVRMLLSLRLLFARGLPVPVSLRRRLSIRGGLSLSAATGGGRGPANDAAAGAWGTSAVERTGSAGAAAAGAAIGARAAEGSVSPRLEDTQKRHQILFLLRRELGAEDQVEELDRVLQRQKTLVMEIGRVVLHTAQSKGFDWAVPDCHHVVNHRRLETPSGLPLVHQIVGVEGRLVASRALTLAEEDLLAPHLRLCRLGRIELA